MHEGTNYFYRNFLRLEIQTPSIQCVKNTKIIKNTLKHMVYYSNPITTAMN